MATFVNADEKPPVAVLFALARESAPFYKLFQNRISLRAHAPCPAWRAWLGDREVVVLETGVGANAAATAVHWLLAERRPRPALVVAAGFAGALRGNLPIGAVIIASAVCDPGGGEWVPTRRSFDDLTNVATGRIVTLDRMIGDPAEKKRLGEMQSAVAVDMESATIAGLCAEHGLPWACVRAISDEMNQPLSPVLLQLLAGSRASPWRLAASLVCRPGLLPELLRLERATRRAARQLAEVLACLLTRGGQLLPPCPPVAAGR